MRDQNYTTIFNKSNIITLSYTIYLHFKKIKCFKFSAYTRPFVVTVMTDPDEGPLGSATDKANRGFNLVRFL